MYFLLKRPIGRQVRDCFGRQSDLLKWVKTRPADPQQPPSGAHTLSALTLPVCTTPSCYCAPTMPMPIANNSLFVSFMQKQNLNLSHCWPREWKKTLACALLFISQTKMHQQHVTRMLFSCMMPCHQVCQTHSAVALCSSVPSVEENHSVKMAGKKWTGVCMFIDDMQLCVHVPYIVVNSRKLSFNDVSY